MAHIVDCIAGTEPNSVISKPVSPSPSTMDLRAAQPPATEKPYVWRMQQFPSSEQPKRYQLFPRERQLPVLNSSKAVDSDKASNMAPTGADKPSAAASLKTKISQHSLVRRRKISVPELGPMTTVQEVPMDSPTIPGRPPLHERSASAPGAREPTRPHDLAMHVGSYESDFDPLDAAIEESFMPDVSKPMSPKQLARLVIPEPTELKPPRLPRRPVAHSRSGSAPDEATRAGRGTDSPSSRTESPSLRNLFSPQSSTTDLTTPRSASTTPYSARDFQTPISAPGMESQPRGFSPKAWEGRSNTPTLMERSQTPQPTGSSRVAVSNNHRRGASESSSSIMDRGRPRKRTDTRQKHGSQLKKRDASEQDSDEQVFEELPSGALPKEVLAKMEMEEINVIQKQAYRQAERFEVLRAEEVECLSKELRQLDERTEYLRRTYTSLRAGRRNLHARICQFLRSARSARFSPESMLKQEEALAELDASIDDWVNKLEKAENRRTRVRQKLLEHVAAAAILSTSGLDNSPTSAFDEQALILPPNTVHDISTPPRSPTKQGSFSSRASSCSPSPQRVVAQVPSTILEHPIVEEAETTGSDETAVGPASLNRADVESIRIYAGDDIYALLADVEKEITKMSSHTVDVPQDMPDSQRKALHRQRSHELLSALSAAPLNTGAAPKPALSPQAMDSPPAPTPPIKDAFTSGSQQDEPILLSKAVFKP